MSKHTMLVTIPHGDPDLGAEMDVKITFEFRKGAPAQGPSYSSGGQPADPDEIELIKAEPYCNGKPSPCYGVFADLEQASIDSLAENWLQDEGFAEALEAAHMDIESARENAAALRVEQAREDDYQAIAAGGIK